MNVSDYIWEYLADKGVTHVFFLPGGGSMHLVDALCRNKRLTGVAMHHEQQCGWASQAHNILTNSLSSVVLVTTGPGGTNAITPCAAAWIDETPMLFISGQVPTSMMMKEAKVVRQLLLQERQRGPQEFAIAPMVDHATKYSIVAFAESDICWLYDEAVAHPRGPVWLDIPLDVQSAGI